MNGLKDLYEDALEWLEFEQASDDIRWYAYRVVTAFRKEAQRSTLSSDGSTPLTISDSIAEFLKPVKGKTKQPVQRRTQSNGC